MLGEAVKVLEPKWLADDIKKSLTIAFKELQMNFTPTYFWRSETIALSEKYNYGQSKFIKGGPQER